MLIEFAQRLDQAAANAKAIKQLSEEKDVSLDEAYEIQKLMIAEREKRGEHVVGVKMGFTSVAKMEQMGVSDMIWGRLTDAMEIPNGGSASLSKYIHPRAEPEVCFRVFKDIKHEVPFDMLNHYVDGMAPAIEIIDSRYENFKFSLEDVVADNCSSTGFVIGEWINPRHDIQNLSMHQYFNDEMVAEGSSADILGDPWRSLQAATRLVTSYGGEMKAGQVVLAGAATAAVFLKPNTEVRVEVQGMKPISCTFTA